MHHNHSPERESSAPIYGVLLAAGDSVRMGQPKQLLDWHGQPFVRHCTQQAQASLLAGLVVVTGAEAAAVRTALAKLNPATGPDIQIINNPAYATGQASSLRVGLTALPTDAAAAVVLLVDQPFITATHINTLITAFQRSASEQPVAIVPCYGGQRGNPVLLAQPLFAELHAELQGDQGARGVLQRHTDQVCWLAVDDPAFVIDIDTPEDYTRVVPRLLENSP